jgi:hypothetical protein
MKRLAVILAGSALTLTLAGHASAAGLSANTGDLFIGFHAISGTGVQQDLLIDIGPASQFENGTSLTLNIGNIGADLTSVFGSWQTDSSLYWGVFGSNTNSSSTTVGTDPVDTLFASRPTGATALRSKTDSTQQAAVNKYTDLSTEFVTNFQTQLPTNSTANSNVATIQQTSDTNSWASYETPVGGVPTNSFGLGAGVPNETSFTNGTANASLDLYRLSPAAGNPLGADLGFFSINDTGTISFTAVPEPSSLSILLVGAGLLGLRRQRKARLA